jgi:hypothetical protein
MAKAACAHAAMRRAAAVSVVVVRLGSSIMLGVREVERAYLRVGCWVL